MRPDPDVDRRPPPASSSCVARNADPVGRLAVHRVDHLPEVRQRARGEVVALGGLDVQRVEPAQRRRALVGWRRGVGRRSRRSPDLSAFLMLRRHSWFMPRSTSSSSRPGQRDRERVLRLAGAETLVDVLVAPAAGRQVLGRRADRPGRARSRTSRRLRTAGSASPSFTCAAVHRRVTTGRTHPDAEGAALLEVRRHRVQPAVEARVDGVRPVDDRALGQVGEREALEPGDRPVQHQAAPTSSAGGVAPADRLGAPLGLDRAPGPTSGGSSPNAAASTNARCSSAEIAATVRSPWATRRGYTNVQ